MPQETFFYVMLEDPLVVVIADGHSLSGGLTAAATYAAGRKCWVLAQSYWHVPDTAAQLAAAVQAIASRTPNLHLTCMVPYPKDVALLSSLGVSAILAHHSAFIDERIFLPDLGTPPRYAAVHIAQTASFKRHHLAFDVPNLALITYSVEGRRREVEHLICSYNHLGYVNYDETSGLAYLRPSDVREVIVRSRCGLILSEKEGGNYSSAEILLCGRPVVSTPSLGGRDVMFDARTVIIVPPDAEAVLGAVAALNRGCPPEENVRAITLAKMLPHRLRLIQWLSGVTDRDLLSEASSTLWLPMFRDKLRQRVALPTLS